MARQTGSTSSISIPLNKLVEKLQAISPTIGVKVSKGWLKSMGEAHDINFGTSDEAETPAETPATAAKAPTVVVE